MSASPARPAGRPLLPFLSTRTGCSLRFQTQLPSLTGSRPAVPFCQSRLCLCVGFPNTVSGKRSGSRSTTVLPRGEGNGKPLLSLGSFQEPLWGPTGPLQP